MGDDIHNPTYWEAVGKAMEAEHAFDAAATSPTPRKRAPKAAAALERGDDVELGGEVLTRLRGDGPAIVHSRGSFYRYEAAAGVWRALDDDEVGRAVMGFAGVTVPGPKGKPVALRVNEGRVRGSSACAARLAGRPDFFDGAPAGICFRNGFVTVDKTGAKLSLHSPEHRATAALHFDYDPRADGTRFGKFLSEIFAGESDIGERLALLSQFIGGCLIGVAPVFEKCLILTGMGGDGKSRLLFILRRLFPPSTVAAVSLQELAGGRAEYYRAQLANKRVNILSELPEAGIVESASIKAVISGDQVGARHPAERPFDYRPTAGHIFAANSLPAVDDATDGFWRRFFILTFPHQFVAGKNADPHVADKIIGAEMPAVAAWAIEGAVRLLNQECYTMPASSAAAMAEWRFGADQVRQFVADEIMVGTGVETRGQPLYDAYRAWAAKAGHQKPMARNKFLLRLKTALGIHKREDAGGSWWPVEVRECS